jgi:hypothetical protein
VARRPIFVPTPGEGLVEERFVEFEWFPGFAVTQKQRSIAALHAAATEEDLNALLEVSTKSPARLGIRLSAFNLSVHLDNRPEPVLLEAAYQGSKVFESSGPHTHLYDYQSGKEVKRYINALPDEGLTGFELAGRAWPLEPKTAFYDWLYLTALRQLSADDDSLDDQLSQLDAFTDIEFNPDNAFNCQARSCALYVALTQLGLLYDALANRTDFLQILAEHQYGTIQAQGQLPGLS